MMYILCPIFAGFGVYSLFVTYSLSRDMNERVSNALYRSNTMLYSIYGVVQSTDTSAKTVTLSIPNPLFEGAHTITLLIDGQTTIAHQELEADNTGSYVGLSTTTPGTFSNLLPGTRVAVAFKSDGERLLATSIFFGNPL